MLSNLRQIHLTLGSVLSDEPVVDRKDHPLAIVVSQDCDLDWDFKARFRGAPKHKLVANVLFCEVEPAENMRKRLRDSGVNSELWRRIERNEDARFHMLAAVAADQDALAEGLPAMGLDFKRFFTIPLDETYVRVVTEAKRRCILDRIPAIDLCQRFAYFLSRVAME